MLGPDVDLRRTEYDVEEAVAAYRRSGLPNADDLAQMPVEPPSRAEVIEHAERVAFAG